MSEQTKRIVTRGYEDRHLMPLDYNYQELCTTIAMEECGELIQAISKAKRGKLDKDNLAEEIADVLIVIDWITEIYNIEVEQVEIWYKKKQDRIATRVLKDDFK